MASPDKAAQTLRLPVPLKERLEVIAKAEGRSLNNLIEQFLSYMAEFYERAPLYSIESLLVAYHEVTWSDAFGPEYDKMLKEMLESDRKAQQQKLKEARKSLQASGPPSPK